MTPLERQVCTQLLASIRGVITAIDEETKLRKNKAKRPPTQKLTMPEYCVCKEHCLQISKWHKLKNSKTTMILSSTNQPCDVCGSLQSRKVVEEVVLS